MTPDMPYTPDTTLATLFGERLRRLRATQGITQTALAARLAVHQSHLSHLETPRSADDLPALTLLVQIARVFAVPVDTLLFVDAFAVPMLPPWPPEMTAFRLLGPKLRHQRMQRGWTLVQLATNLQDERQTRYTDGFLSNVEHGRKRITVPALYRLVRVTGLASDYYLRDDLPVDPAVALALPPNALPHSLAIDTA